MVLHRKHKQTVLTITQTSWLLTLIVSRYSSLFPPLRIKYFLNRNLSSSSLSICIPRYIHVYMHSCSSISIMPRLMFSNVLWNLIFIDNSNGISIAPFRGCRVFRSCRKRETHVNMFSNKKYDNSNKTKFLNVDEARN